MRSHFIRPSYSPEGMDDQEFEAYSTFIESILESVLPSSFLSLINNSTSHAQKLSAVEAFYFHLPLVFWRIPDTTPSTLSISLLCPSEQTYGVGRYLCDVCSRWLIPGAFLNISSVRSLNFYFTIPDTPAFFFHQVLIDLHTDRQLQTILEQKDSLEKEIRLTILAVRHTRHIVSATKLSQEQKKTLIEETLSSYLISDHPDKRTSLFQQIHNLWIQVSAEDKIKQLQEQFSPFLEQKTRSFDRSIFDEIKHSLLMLKDHFTATRSLRHVSRLISYQYLFRKTLQRKILHQPQERHLSLKLLKNPISQEPVLGIFGAISLIRENELFEEKHLLEAISRCLPFITTLSDSLILDKSSHDPLRFFYLEVQKNNKDPFTLQEVQELKKSLPRELKESVETVLPPILMQRNEEEILRNILLLAEQIRYVNDKPQVIISFTGQTEQDLQFTIVLVRLLRGNTLSISTYFQEDSSDLKIEEIETKKAGLLRKRYVKEANILKVRLDKTPFVRRDFSIDLIKARQKVSSELHQLFHGVRDFNGGILLKQQETFQQLKSLVQSTSTQQDFFLENFFYSLSPPIKQTLIAPHCLKLLFFLIQEALDADYQKTPFFLQAQTQEEHLLIVAASRSIYLKEKINSLLNALKIPTSSLSQTQVTAYEVHALGYIYHGQDPSLRDLLYSTLSTHLREWYSTKTQKKHSVKT